MGIFFTQEFWFVFLILILSSGLFYVIISEIINRPKGRKKRKLKRKYRRMTDKRGKINSSFVCFRTGGRPGA